MEPIMAASPQTIRSMALYCDFETLALGVRDAKYDKFDIDKVLERLLLKGSIVVKKAYCDWDRYKGFKAAMHEAAFELIEIPHVRMSGKNSADIRMVVDALDLCYTKSHVDTFVIISGDSDFSPLVSKLRENNKVVIGVGVKNSTSDLLIANCDEFLYYDDLVRTAKKTPKAAKRDKGAPEVDKRQEAVDRVLEVVHSVEQDYDPLWGSTLKQAIRRVYPGFNEGYYGYGSFSDLLEDIKSKGLIDLEYDDSRGNYKVRPKKR
jgi:uncharacterized protein (TIGR00288 family)